MRHYYYLLTDNTILITTANDDFRERVENLRLRSSDAMEILHFLQVGATRIKYSPFARNRANALRSLLGGLQGSAYRVESFTCLS